MYTYFIFLYQADLFWNSVYLMNSRLATIFAALYHTIARDTSLDDKIVQQAVSTVLSAMYEEDFIEINY